MAVVTNDKQLRDDIKAGNQYYKAALKTTLVKYVPSLDVVVLHLSNGTRMVLPREQLQGLQHASRRQIANVELLGGGIGLHWPDLDADLWVEGLVNGVYGTRQWMSELGRLGGSVRSKPKAEAARLNGLKGGRPPKEDAAVACDGPIQGRASAEPKAIAKKTRRQPSQRKVAGKARSLNPRLPR